MSQYALSLTLPPVFAEDNFFVSASNREAHQWVTQWPDWFSGALLITGPAGCGKSHLAHIWAARSGAAIASAASIRPDQVKHPVLVEDIETIRDETALLHLYNHCREKNFSLLLTSRLQALQLPFTLPDLTSRLRAMPSALIAPPDDELLAAAMRKQFADRQLKVDEEVIAYIVPRMERSLAAASALVDTLDKRALAAQKDLTIPFVRQVLQG